jgi:hypothetical protein
MKRTSNPCPPASAAVCAGETRRHGETYRGYRIEVEQIVDAGGVSVRRTLSRRLGERYAAVSCHASPAGDDSRLPQPARAARRSFDDAIQEAREAVDRLLGGWHPAYAAGTFSCPMQAGAEAAPAPHARSA